MQEDRIPQRARNTLYIIWVVLSIAQPFATVWLLTQLNGETLVQAFITTISVIGTFAGATALAHPTHKRGDHDA